MLSEFEKTVKAVYAKWKSKLPPARGAHPDEEEFCAFLEKRLPPQDEARLKNHFLACPECSEILATSIKVAGAGEIAPPENLLDAARELVNKGISSRSLDIILLVKDKLLEVINTTGDVLLGQELIPAAVLRSRQIKEFRDEVSILKDFESIRVEVKIISRSGGAFSLAVLIKNKQTQQVFKDLRVSLIKADTELESYSSDSGKVVFEHVLFGKYTVEISSTREKMASILIDIKV